MRIKMAILFFTFTQILSPVLAPPHDLGSLQDLSKSQTSASDPKCQTIRTNQLTITCAYTADSHVKPSKSEPRIILNGAVISFDPSNESHMHVELSFTND